MTKTTNWQDWREEASDVCAVPLAQRLAALLDQDAMALRAGDPLPQGWHMILFTPLAPQSTLGPDGHPTGQAHFGPPELPRRMLGGRRTRFLAPLPLDAKVWRVSEVAGMTEKQARSGRLAVVTLRHTIGVADAPAPALIEEQDVLYREAIATEAPAAGKSAPTPDLGAAAAADAVAPHPAPVHTRTLTPGPALLFRYSAITFNAHRIHYDAPYATGTEGYPALIVNGGLTMLLLIEMLKAVVPAPLRLTTARNRRPLFCGRPLRLCIAPAATGWSLWAEDDKGRIALEASAE
ncbi:MAG: hypothetical protein P4L71_07225 [Acetobacteraceae bacterium]|nr:hypothetical protein [Acetobacteraceae bacterium]